MSPKFAVCIATIPSRVRHLPKLLKTIGTWTIPPTKIFVTMSPYYHRFKCKLEPEQIPLELKQNPIVEILWREDLGSINKIFWVLREHRQEFNFILSLDDDRNYPKEIVEDLLRGSEAFKKSVLCIRGRRFVRPLTNGSFSETVSVATPKDTQEIDIVLGTDGVLYPTEAFGSDFFELYEKSLTTSPFLRFTDDIFISGYLAAKGISRRVIPTTKLAGKHPRVSLKRSFAKLLSLYTRFKTLDDRLWAINRTNSYNDQGIAFWTQAWRPS